MPFNKGLSGNTDIGFQEGREFRLTEPIDNTLAAVVVRVTSPINFVLKLQKLSATSGSITMLAYRSDAGIPSGTFVPSKYYANNNQQTGITYVGQIQVDVGGVFVPTNVLNYKDKLSVLVANATAHASNVGEGL